MRLLLLLALSLAASSAFAQFVPWQRMPGISVIGAAADDPRRPLVDEAVAFWNNTLREIGSGFRLGAVVQVTQPVPEEALREMSASLLSGAPVPQALRDLPGDVTVLLAESAFVSFTGTVDPGRKRVVGIRGLGGWPMTLPNVPRNLIAHELGHVVGLGHNSYPAYLMCGRPAPCRPDAFHAPEPRMFPLTDDEKSRLLRLYPADWKPSAPQ